MHYGVSWYPEQKTRQAFEHDLNLLIESGFTVVRMGEFAWTKMEPEPGQFNFDWLDEAVDRLGKAGVKSIICTPTACPPAWLVQLHPDLLYVDNRGVQRPFGGRREYCYTHPQYRQYSERIAAKLAEHYGSHPDVIGFQIDNEPAQEATGRCHCEHCQQAFRGWLMNRFESIEALNEAGGMIFWNQTYQDFSQIRLPVNSIEVNTADHIKAYYESPSLRLWAENFASEAQIEYQNQQLYAMKKHTDKKITTNATGLATNSIDYYQSFSDLDVYAFDYYPSLLHPISSAAYAFGRGIKNQPLWLMEFVSGGGHCLNGKGRSQPWPGAMQHSVVHAAAHDTDLVAHFQFRTFPSGAEQLNYSIVDADGRPGRRYHECQDTAAVLKELEPVLNASDIKNDIALIFDYQSYWALTMKPVNQDLHYTQLIEEIYKQLTDLGYGVDIIGASRLDEASRYKMLIAPALTNINETQQKQLADYTANGGVLAATFLTSIKNENNVGYTSALPAGLNQVFGMRVAEVDPVFDHSRQTYCLCSELNMTQLQKEQGFGKTRSWCEILKLEDAFALATFCDGYRQNLPLMSGHHYGQGKAYYLGTRIEGQTADTVWHYLAEQADISPQSPVKQLPVGCQTAVRYHKDGSRLIFLFNFNEKETEIAFEGSFELLNQTRLEKTAEAYEVAVSGLARPISETKVKGLPLQKAGSLTLGPCQWVLLKEKKES